VPFLAFFLDLFDGRGGHFFHFAYSRMSKRWKPSGYSMTFIPEGCSIYGP
jgi:hypothetical protein